ncbi:DUF4145 domain-containing protein [Sinorhizobium meliloti]|uniref:DUF4145 domain-containing protein n=1 Tax=Rhizobium meliloti TaxID=382 RepID=UPI001F2E2E8F|nr:DUF4145 domain-containing protein [Sinorhizobium meliloti]
MVTDQNHYRGFIKLHNGQSKFGDTGLLCLSIRCVNADCNEVFVGLQHTTAEIRGGTWRAGDLIEEWQLRPDSISRVQPDFIPIPLREDYYEACLIRDKSPKASAALARRCLQGMIRDFCGISKNRLIDEIKELKTLVEAGKAPKGVEPETLDAIDAIRNIGNIGAHMERDIDVIVEVDPGEAQALIELIEMLFEEWYIARHKREQRLASVRAIAAEKQVAIESGKAQIAQKKLAAIADHSSAPEE